MQAGEVELDRPVGAGQLLDGSGRPWDTSFNLCGEPIVHRPTEAVADFLGSDMDALFLGSLLAAKT